MPKKSRAMREIEAMEFAARRELAEVAAARDKIAARLDTLQDMKTRLEKDPMKRKPKKPSNLEKAVKLLDEAAAEAVRKRNSQEEAAAILAERVPGGGGVRGLP